MATSNQFSFEPCESLRQRTLISSVGGFSQPAVKQIRSLQELLRAIQPLLLQIYEGSRLQEEKFLGEGISYKVFRCRETRSQKVVAVKQVKMPLLTPDFESLQSRVSCVLKDIEVMHHEPIAHHPNIIKLLGYGWQLQRGSIPFLVTECAALGTLRQYLGATPLSARQQQKLCRHVALGLHELHLSGIAHGDLKLDNVLVALEPCQQAANIPTADDDSQCLVPVAKISDFGNSLLLSENQGGSPYQRYHGTISYNAPELFGTSYSRQIDWKSINFRKCDIWAFGLLCLEALSSGMPYYHNPEVKDELSHSSGSITWSGDRTLVVSNGPHNDLLAALRPWIRVIALNLARRLQSRLASISFIETFRRCLVCDPVMRTDNASTLPILAYGACRELPQARPRLGNSSEQLGQWLFESFRPRQIAEIPHIAKSQILSDSQWLAYSESSSSPRASFQAGIAHAIGFGTKKNQAQFIALMKHSSEKGNPLAAALLPFISNLFFKDGVNHPQEYSQTLALAFKNLFEPCNPPVSCREEGQACTDVQEAGSSPGRSKLVLSLDELSVNIDARDVTTGETSLLRAAKSGNAKMVGDLLDCGANPTLRAKDDSTILHWLFMFPSHLIGEICEKICQRMLPTEKTALLGQSTSSACVLDSQFPLELWGTPLSFAVATASEQAVAVLLKLGANPTTPTIRARHPSRHGCPLWLAASLHLDNAFTQMMTQISNYPKQVPYEYDDSLILLTLSESSPLEREFIHGNRAIIACQETVRSIALFGTAFDNLGNILAGLEAAISATDIAVANAILDACQNLGNNADARNSLHICRVGVLRAALHTACRDIYDRNTGIGLILFALSQGLDLNATAQHYHMARPIFVTIEYQREDLFNFLLNRGANLTARDEQGRCAVHFFAIHGFFKSPAKMIVEANISLDPVDYHGASPLHYAAKSGRLTEMQLLLEHGASTKLTDAYGRRVLHNAVISNQSRIVDAVLSYETDINAQDNTGMTALAIASKAGLHQIVKLLLERGADTSLATSLTQLPLHLAAEAQKPLVIRQLLRDLSDVEVSDLLAARSASGMSPLDFAIAALVHEDDSHATCDMLLRFGADPPSSLLIAIRRQCVWLVRYLLRYNPSLVYFDLREGEFISALTTATLLGNSDIVKLLLDKGADCNKLDGRGNNAIHHAVQTQQCNLLEIFLATPAPVVDACNRTGSSALELAIKSGQYGSKQLAAALCFQLLAAGARFPYQHKTWSQWLRRSDLEFLRSVGRITNSFGVGSTRGEYRLVMEFISQGIHSTISETGGLTSLHVWAILPDIVKLSWWIDSPGRAAVSKAIACLLDCGASGLATDNAGRSALSAAVNANNTVVCGALLTQYALVIDGLKDLSQDDVLEYENHSRPNRSRSKRQICNDDLRSCYRQDIQTCWRDAILDCRWDIVDVFVASKINIDMTAMKQLILEHFFVPALKENMVLVLREFTGGTTQDLETAYDSTKLLEQTASSLPTQFRGRLLRWVGPDANTIVLQHSNNHSAKKDDTDLQRFKERLQQFWQKDIVEPDFAEVKKMVPEKTLPLLARLIIEYGITQKIKSTMHMLQHYSRSGPSICDAADESRALRACSLLMNNISDMFALNRTHPWPIRLKRTLVKGISDLLALQSEILITQAMSRPFPKELASLREGFDLLDIRTNAFVHFVRDTANKVSPALAVHFAFIGILVLQALLDPEYREKRPPTHSARPSLAIGEVFLTTELEVEKVFHEIVKISMVAGKADANILDEAWMHAISSSAMKPSKVEKAIYFYRARIVKSHSVPTSSAFKLGFGYDATSPPEYVDVLTPVGRWWLVKKLDSIGFAPARCLALLIIPCQSCIYVKTNYRPLALSLPPILEM